MSLLTEIHEANLAYLFTLRRAIAEDRADVLCGMSDTTQAWVAALTLKQLSDLSRSSMLICRFMADPAELLRELGPSDGRPGDGTQTQDSPTPLSIPDAV